MRYFLHGLPTTTQISMRILIRVFVGCPHEEILHHWLSKLNILPVSNLSRTKANKGGETDPDVGFESGICMLASQLISDS